MSDAAGIQFSIVIPVYNEQDNLVPLADEIDAAMANVDVAYEVIFVNDCSRDDSGAILDELVRTRPRYRVVNHSVNSGESAAQATGFRVAHGTFVITMDADRQNDPADLPRFIAACTDDVDCVNGVRQRRLDSWLKRVSSRIANRWRNAVLGEKVADAGCTYRAMRRTALREVPVFNGMHRFIPTILRLQGFRISESPVNHRPRVAGVSKYGLHNRLWRGLRDCMAMRWYRKRVVPGDRIASDTPGTDGTPGSGNSAGGSGGVSSDEPHAAAAGAAALPAPSPKAFVKLGVLLALCLAAVLIVRFTPLKEYVGDAQHWKTWIDQSGALGPVVFVAATALLVALGVPRLALCVVGGMLFGFVEGLILSQIGSLLGAYSVFLTARWGGRSAAQSLLGQSRRLRRFVDASPTFWTVFLIRQIPLPGLLINTVLGVSAVSYSAYLLGTLLGFLPEATIATLAGSGLLKTSPQFAVLQMLSALALCVLFFMFIRWLRVRVAARANDSALADAPVDASPVPGVPGIPGAKSDVILSTEGVLQ